MIVTCFRVLVAFVATELITVYVSLSEYLGIFRTSSRDLNLVAKGSSNVVGRNCLVVESVESASKYVRMTASDGFICELHHPTYPALLFCPN